MAVQYSAGNTWVFGRVRGMEFGSNFFVDDNERNFQWEDRRPKAVSQGWGFSHLGLGEGRWHSKDRVRDPSAVGGCTLTRRKCASRRRKQWAVQSGAGKQVRMWLWGGTGDFSEQARLESCCDVPWHTNLDASVVKEAMLLQGTRL